MSGLDVGFGICSWFFFCFMLLVFIDFVCGLIRPNILQFSVGVVVSFLRAVDAQLEGRGDEAHGVGGSTGGGGCAGILGDEFTHAVFK